MQNSVKGKQIKDYILGQSLLSFGDTTVLEATTKQGRSVTLVMIEKKNMEQETFVQYNNLLAQNTQGLHPRYIEVVQSAHNMYIVLEHLERPTATKSPALPLIGAFVQLYAKLGQFKVEKDEILLTDAGKLTYLPLYRKLQTTSRFYAQFHNKSALGELFSRLTTLSNQNIALDMFIKYVDDPKATEILTRQLQKQQGPAQGYPALQKHQGNSKKEAWEYPDLQQNDDEEIMALMSKVQVNPNMKKEAGQQFRQSSQNRHEQEEGKEIKGIIDKVQSSMFQIKTVKSSKAAKSKMEVKLSQSKVDSDQFNLYFASYCQSLKFMKRCFKHFLTHQRRGFSGIICAYLLALTLTLRKAYMIRDLEAGEDIFELGSQSKFPKDKYVNYLKKDLQSQGKVVVELRNVVENCRMPVHTYGILAPYLEDDISQIDYSKLHSFLFFLLSVLLRGRPGGSLHEMYVIDLMYILLHKNYEIVFFEDEFPNKWDQDYFDTKVLLIQSLVPNWNLQSS